LEESDRDVSEHSLDAAIHNIILKHPVVWTVLLASCSFSVLKVASRCTDYDIPASLILNLTNVNLVVF
jgi:hypothetical protein